MNKLIENLLTGYFLFCFSFAVAATISIAQQGIEKLDAKSLIAGFFMWTFALLYSAIKKIKLQPPFFPAIALNAFVFIAIGFMDIIEHTPESPFLIAFDELAIQLSSFTPFMTGALYFLFVVIVAIERNTG